MGLPGSPVPSAPLERLYHPPALSSSGATVQTTDRTQEMQPSLGSVQQPRLGGRAVGGTAASEELLAWGHPEALHSAPFAAAVLESPKVQKSPTQQEEDRATSPHPRIRTKLDNACYEFFCEVNAASSGIFQGHTNLQFFIDNRHQNHE
ncbi:hypothetical protein UY3_09826 [Chelonia mydas]|uniref:Uncharacterized protein n=1 Tax=Chelonia mydas TaxID=8469 RepID=M7B7D8_CHEMY|nr:hypothetical protein UY3_09826 [Chelonia mydas]